MKAQFLNNSLPRSETWDLESPNAAASLEEANISEVGAVKSTDGTSEWDKDWQGLISAEGVNPPKIIERPEIPISDEARKARTYGKVKITGIINKSGGIQDLKIVKGLERNLDKRALEGVKNSWVLSAGHEKWRSDRCFCYL